MFDQEDHEHKNQKATLIIPRWHNLLKNTEPEEKEEER